MINNKRLWQIKSIWEGEFEIVIFDKSAKYPKTVKSDFYNKVGENKTPIRKTKFTIKSVKNKKSIGKICLKK